METSDRPRDLVVGSLLTREDYQRILTVIEDCERAHSSQELQRLALMSLREQFGYLACAVTSGPPPERMLACDGGMMLGLPGSAEEEFHERWAHLDPFFGNAGRLAVAKGQLVSVDDFADSVEPERRPFVERFLRRLGVTSYLACWLNTELTTHNYLILFSNRPALSDRDKAVVAALRPHLTHFVKARMLLDHRQAPIASLPPRLQEVAQLVGQGLSNREIAGALVISEESARKYVSRCLNALDLKRRTQLALAALANE